MCYDHIFHRSVSGYQPLSLIFIVKFIIKQHEKEWKTPDIVEGSNQIHINHIMKG